VQKPVLATFQLWLKQTWPTLLVVVLSLCIRGWQLGQVPHGMTWDEAAIGYSGFAIVTTRRDEWLHRLPISFQSFGDYKAPLAIYLNGLFTTGLRLGLDAWAIRLPFMLSGVVGVLGTILLTNQLLLLVGLTDASRRQRLSLLTGIWLALSPWHIHFTRIGFESGIALTIIIWASFFWLKAIESKAWYFWLLSVLGWSASLYAYHSAKIVAPLLVLGFCLLYWQKIRNQLKLFLFMGIIGALSLVPLIFDTFWGPGLARAGTLIFSQSPNLTAFLTILGKNLLAHLSLDFWVKGATTTLRHSDGAYGIVYWVDLVLLIFTGLLLLLRTFWSKLRSQYPVQLWQKRWWLIASAWTVIGLLPSILGTEVPHPNRSLLAIIGIAWLISVSCDWFISHWSKQKISWTILGVAYLISFSFYQWHYYTVFAKESAKDFFDGYIEAAQITTEYEKQTLAEGKPIKILFTSGYGQPYIFILLVKRTNPIWYQGGSLVNYEFTDKLTIGDLQRKNTLIVGGNTDSIPTQGADKLVYGSDGLVKFKIFFPRDEP
jgi:hypothetical protein